MLADLKKTDRIVDIHVHFDDKNSNFVEDLLKVCNRLNLTACVLTPYNHRTIIADAAKRYPAQIVPIGFVDLDAKDAVEQVREFHKLGYRGLGELEFVKHPFTAPAYMPVYELANEYRWVVLFHTGIVLRRNFDEPEDVASYRMRAFHLEEVARRFPQITVIGAHCGNPEYEWAAEVARWNPNVFFDQVDRRSRNSAIVLASSARSSGGRELTGTLSLPTMTPVHSANWCSDRTRALTESKAWSANIAHCSRPAEFPNARRG